jgi:SurA N-terminal domain
MTSAPAGVAVLLCGLSAVALAQTPGAPPRSLPPCPEIAARVNGRPITLAQLRLKGETGMRSDPAAQGNREDAYQNAMNELLRRELLFQDAERHHFSAEPAMIEAAEQELQSSFGDEAAWQAFLRAQGFDRAWVRGEMRVQETARTYSGCYGEEQVPLASDADALSFYRAYNSEDPNTPSARVIESWRQQVTRNKRNMAVREQLDNLFATAKIERYFVRGQCTLPVASPK